VLREPEDDLDTVRVLEVDPDGAPPAVPLRERPRRIGRVRGHLRGTVDPDDVGTHVGELQGAERQRAEARELDHGDAGQRAAHRGGPGSR
jgi:hypothetical protein